jgi:cephalosporin hydroxylase
MTYKEIIFQCKPNVVIETGVALGGDIALISTYKSAYARWKIYGYRH